MIPPELHLVDCILPAVPIRQFVLSFPFELSLLAATKPEVLRALARIHAEELARHYKQAAQKSGETGKLHAGAVTFVQRFGSSLNLHVHLHTCALDGVYVEGEEGEVPRFVPAEPPSRAELYVLIERVALRVMRWLRKRGHAKDDDHASNETPDRTFAEVLAQLATQRGTLENVKDDTGEGIARLCALVPPPRYPLTRFHGVLAPRAKLRPRVVPKLPGSAARACASASSRPPDRREPRGQVGERPPPRDKTGPIVPAGLPVSATTLARSIDGALVPMPNVLSTRHLARIAGGLLFAATSDVPWATLLARTFQIDVRACARCGGRLQVRAVVTDHDIARKILDAIPPAARAPPPADPPVAYDPALA